MSDSEKLLTRAAWERAMNRQPMTGDDMMRILSVLEGGINIYMVSQDEVIGLKEQLVSFLGQWQQSLTGNQQQQ